MFMVGFQEGGNLEEDVVTDQFVDLKQFLSEPMQAKRDQMMQDIKNGVFNPADFGKVAVVVGVRSVSIVFRSAVAYVGGP